MKIEEESQQLLCWRGINHKEYQCSLPAALLIFDNSYGNRKFLGLNAAINCQRVNDLDDD